MKRDKKLQNFADQSLSEYHNQEVANELKAVIETNNINGARKPKRRKVFWVTAGVSAVITAVILSLLIVIPFFNNQPTDKIYYAGNQITVNSDLASLNSDLSQIQFNLDSDVFIGKVEDKLYDETLYYSITITNDSGEALEIIAVTNNDYNYSFVHEYDKKMNIENLTLSYSESFEFLEEDMYYVESFGEIITETDKLYFSYNGIAFENNSSFTEHIKQMIKIK